LIAGVLSAVHHAEIVAHRIGEPFGTLVLALAVTLIEVALIVSLMASGGPAATIRRTVIWTPWRECVARDDCFTHRGVPELHHYGRRAVL
jgi:hypothetical protein